MMTKMEQLILDFISAEGYKPSKVRELARSMRVPHNEYPTFRRSVKGLLNAGKLDRLRGGRVGKADTSTLVTGTLSVTKSGRAFVMPEKGQPEIIITQQGIGTGLNGDEVQVRVFSRDVAGRPVGEIARVIKRKTVSVVGKYYESRFHCFVVPDDPRLKIEVTVPPPKDKVIRDGTKVVVQLEEWKDPNHDPHGKIIHILGMPGEPSVDVLSIIHRYQLPTHFPPSAEAEAAAISDEIPAEEIARRLDLRRETVVTIDPEDAKDHDDAVSLEKTRGGYRLGVHIADVSHYVASGSKLDREARQRTASAYLVDRVLPMLPEQLSNNVCSLREKSDRLTLSIIIDLDPEGNVRGHQVRETVTHSQARLTYEQVQLYLDAGRGFERQKRIGHKLQQMAELAAKLIEKRRKGGSIDFDLPEYKVQIDESGIVRGVHRRQRLFSHRIVEEFMLLANRQVAAEMLRRRLPALFRVHPPPDEEKLEAFRDFAASFGHRAAFGHPTRPGHIAAFLDSIKGRPEADVLNELLVRSMQKAFYQPENIGHFGLAFPMYLHFTSPIRRYPDLVVHRVLKSHLNGAYRPAQSGALKSSLSRIGSRCSEQEIVIMEAERETVALKQAQFLSQQLGEVFEGVISGMLRFGFFVRLLDIGAEGMVRLSTLEDDFYTVDLNRFVLTGQIRRKRYKLGDRVFVQVVAVSIDNGEIDFRLVHGKDKPQPTDGTKKKRRRR